MGPSAVNQHQWVFSVNALTKHHVYWAVLADIPAIPALSSRSQGRLSGVLGTSPGVYLFCCGYFGGVVERCCNLSLLVHSSESTSPWGLDDAWQSELR